MLTVDMDAIPEVDNAALGAAYIAAKAHESSGLLSCITEAIRAYEASRPRDAASCSVCTGSKVLLTGEPCLICEQTGLARHEVIGLRKELSRVQKELDRCVEEGLRRAGALQDICALLGPGGRTAPLEEAAVTAAQNAVTQTKKDVTVSVLHRALGIVLHALARETAIPRTALAASDALRAIYPIPALEETRAK